MKHRTHLLLFFLGTSSIPFGILSTTITAAPRSTISTTDENQSSAEQSDQEFSEQFFSIDIPETDAQPTPKKKFSALEKYLINYGVIAVMQLDTAVRNTKLIYATLCNRSHAALCILTKAFIQRAIKPELVQQYQQNRNSHTHA